MPKKPKAVKAVLTDDQKLILSFTQQWAAKHNWKWAALVTYYPFTDALWRRMHPPHLSEILKRGVELSRPPLPMTLEGIERMTDEQIKYLVNRFLGWKLPADFRPDAGISFKAEYNEHTRWPAKHEPVGTNLFDATQADAMVRYMIEGMP